MVVASKQQLRQPSIYFLFILYQIYKIAQLFCLIKYLKFVYCFYVSLVDVNKVPEPQNHIFGTLIRFDTTLLNFQKFYFSVCI